jgi:hypothetical protein
MGDLVLIKTDDIWEFTWEEGWFIQPPYPYHQRLRAVSKNKSDPDVVIDPLNNEYQLVPKGQSPTSEGWRPLAGRGQK